MDADPKTMIQEPTSTAFHAASGSLPDVDRLQLSAEEDSGKLATRAAMGSSEDMTWPTPQYAFDALNMEFGFTLDPCCWPSTAKCPKYFTPKENGLVQDWSEERVFMNPPYGREIGVWMRKARAESQRGALVVCLVPARVDTEWWHESATRGEVRFLKGRLKNANGQGWPFPVAIIVFRPHAYRIDYADLFAEKTPTSSKEENR